MPNAEKDHNKRLRLTQKRRALGAGAAAFTVPLLLVLAAPGAAKAQRAQTSPAQSQTAQAANPGQARYQADKDVDVGEFYLHKGDADAAIGRFKEAAQLRPDWGKPRLLLGEAFEKKHDSENAVKYYRDYLRVYPKAPDRKKIEKKISELLRS